MLRERDECLAGNHCEPDDYKEACVCLGQHSVRSMREMAVCIGKPEKYVQQRLSRWDDAHPLRGDLIASLTIASGPTHTTRNFVLVRFVSRDAGGAFIPLPQMEFERDEVDGAVCILLERVTDLAKELHASWRDRKIDGGEHHKLTAKARALHEATASVEAMVDAIYQSSVGLHEVPKQERA